MVSSAAGHVLLHGQRLAGSRRDQSGWYVALRRLTVPRSSLLAGLARARRAIAAVAKLRCKGGGRGGGGSGLSAQLLGQHPGDCPVIAKTRMVCAARNKLVRPKGFSHLHNTSPAPHSSPSYQIIFGRQSTEAQTCSGNCSSRQGSRCRQHPQHLANLPQQVQLHCQAHASHPRARASWCTLRLGAGRPAGGRALKGRRGAALLSALKENLVVRSSDTHIV